jgi:hypothetical protein
MSGSLANAAVMARCAGFRSSSSSGRSPPPCEHPDGEILLSLFRGPYSVVTAATLLVEIGDCRARDPTGVALAGSGAGEEAVTRAK